MIKTKEDLVLGFELYQKSNCLKDFTTYLSMHLFNSKLRDDGTNYFDNHLKPVGKLSESFVRDYKKDLTYSIGLLHDFAEDLPKILNRRHLEPKNVLKYLNYLFENNSDTRRLINPIGLMTKPSEKCLIESIENGISFDRSNFPEEIISKIKNYGHYTSDEKPDCDIEREIYYCLRKPLRIFHENSQILGLEPTLEDRILASVVAIADLSNNLDLKDKKTDRVIRKSNQMIYLGKNYLEYIKKQDKTKIVEIDFLKSHIVKRQKEAFKYLKNSSKQILPLNTLEKYLL